MGLFARLLRRLVLPLHESRGNVRGSSLTKKEGEMNKLKNKNRSAQHSVRALKDEYGKVSREEVQEAMERVIKEHRPALDWLADK
jgi:hypothetical protein